MIKTIFSKKTAFIMASSLIMMTNPALAGGLLPGADKIILPTYKVIYDLSLDDAMEAPISSVEGRIVAEISGSKCEGYTTNFRQVTAITTQTGQQIVSDSQVSSYENATGDEYHFQSKNFTNQALAAEITGMARLQENGEISVRMTKPERQEKQLKNAIFPMVQVKNILQAAKDGRTTYAVDLYDGTSNDNTAYHTLTIIGKAETPTENEKEKLAKFGEVSQKWNVTTSYFEIKAPSPETAAADNDNLQGEATPDFTISSTMYDNSIADNLRINYNDFIVRGDIAELTALQKADCNH